MSEQIEQAIEKAIAIFKSEDIVVQNEIVNSIRAQYGLPLKSQKILLIVREEENNELQCKF